MHFTDGREQREPDPDTNVVKDLKKPPIYGPTKGFWPLRCPNPEYVATYLHLIANQGEAGQRLLTKRMAPSRFAHLQANALRRGNGMKKEPAATPKGKGKGLSAEKL